MASKTVRQSQAGQQVAFAVFLLRVIFQDSSTGSTRILLMRRPSISTTVMRRPS
jgi:hypothetical protein